MSTFVQGDTAPPLTGACTTAGQPADMTGATGTVHVRKPDGTVLSRTATWTSQAQGAWSLTWQPGDLDTPGAYQAEVEVTYTGGAVQTFGPVSFYVQPQLA